MIYSDALLTMKSEVVHETKFSLEIFYSTNNYLAQLDKHKSRWQEVLGSVPAGSNFCFSDFFFAVPQLCIIWENSFITGSQAYKNNLHEEPQLSPCLQKYMEGYWLGKGPTTAHSKEHITHSTL